MENFGILSVLHYLCRRKLTEMKQITLIIACVWMTLAAYAQRTIIVEKGSAQSLLAAISEPTTGCRQYCRAVVYHDSRRGVRPWRDDVDAHQWT